MTAPAAAEPVEAAAAALRRDAWRLAAAADQLAATGDRAARWHGQAAAAAAQEQGELAAAARRSAAARTAAQQALVRCAAQLVDAERLRVRAADLRARDALAQRAAQQARDRERASGGPGVFLPPYAWDADSPLSRAARAVAAEADELAERATRAAGAALAALRPPPAPPGWLRRQVGGFVAGFRDSLAATAELGTVLSPVAALVDHGRWVAAERRVSGDLRRTLADPRRALSSLLGWDRLRRGDLGGWLGGLAAGAAVPGGRVGRVGRAGWTRPRRPGTPTLRHPGTGGAVVRRPGAQLPSGYPERILDLAEDRRRHILDGDASGGGHRHNGRPGKSWFPRRWSDDTIIDGVLAAVRAPEAAQRLDAGSYRALGRYRGRLIEVLVKGGEVWTAYPVPERRIRMYLEDT